MKRFQNKVAESRKLLPCVALYGIVVWVVNGLLSPYYPLASKGITGGAWVQLGCLALSAALMVILNNSNALIRTYSRTVSASFIVLTCLTCFQFNSVSGAILGLCAVASYLTAFRTYQDKQATGWTFYSFLCVGMASLLFVQVLWFVPVLWLLMQLQLNSLSWRTFFASILGLLTPYWVIMPYVLWQADVQWLVAHFVSLTEVSFPHDFRQLTVSQILSFALITLLTLTSIIHFLRNASADKIRTRQFYGCFILMALLCIAAMVLQPQHYDPLMRLLIINTSPLLAHFITLTHTRITDIAFKVICVVTLLLTIFNLWMPSLTF